MEIGLVASPSAVDGRHGLEIGVVLHSDAHGVFVHRVLHGGPAHLSGKIATGDYVEEVDRKRVYSAQDAADCLRTPLGTPIEIRLRQGGSGDSSYVYLLRQDVEVESDVIDQSVGISAALRVVKEGVAVDKVMPGGAADLSGILREGCLITGIDGAKVTGNFHQNEIAVMIRGPEGSRVTLEFVPDFTGGHPRFDRLQFVDLVTPWPRITPTHFP